jgi:hypothetical protein
MFDAYILGTVFPGFFFLILALKIINKIQLDLKIIHFSQKITKTKICCHGNHDNV